MKKCCTCGLIKEFNDFHKDKNSGDGVCRKCINCALEYAKNYKKNNKDRIKSSQAKWYVKNAEKDNARCKEYRDKNKEKCSIQKAKYYQDNIDEIKLKKREFRKNNKDKIKPSRKSSKANRRSKIKGQKVSSREINLILWLQQYKCAYCCCDISEGYHLDHIMPISRGGENLFYNLVGACPPCNLSKGAKLLYEWI